MIVKFFSTIKGVPRTGRGHRRGAVYRALSIVGCLLCILQETFARIHGEKRSTFLREVLFTDKKIPPSSAGFFNAVFVLLRLECYKNVLVSIERKLIQGFTFIIRRLGTITAIIRTTERSRNTVHLQNGHLRSDVFFLFDIFVNIHFSLLT